MKVKISEKIYESIMLKRALDANQNIYIDDKSKEQKQEALKRLASNEFGDFYQKGIPFYVKFLERYGSFNAKPMKFSLVDIDVDLDGENEVVFKFIFKNSEIGVDIDFIVEYNTVKDTVVIKTGSGREIHRQDIFISTYATKTLLKMFNMARLLQRSVFYDENMEMNTKIRPMQYWFELNNKDLPNQAV